ncbi:MAG: hypothetical protein C4532_01180 [Candidatus Abyssobacteria bacterium SURF_17]|uniref:YHS domain-containing protein n=1 Tax=Candidatus Abyssobacteria bacterium SURF_17 TaxID=2093361 RepID=A0A419F8V7_9BACT|nr:MAG: hypothetical protein C4532_01180 [Candidatus Abyssubacteria bacterium SURF_17]
MMNMKLGTSCQVCAKPLSEGEMRFEKKWKGKAYFACCPICFSLLQKDPERYIDRWLSSGLETWARK